MIQDKRGRGRPPGASRLNAPDAKILNQMADIIAGRPVPSTTAMRQLGIEDDTTIRRLRRKWNAGGPVLVQAIKARRVQIAARTACEQFSVFANAPELAAVAKSLNAFAASPVWLELGRKLEAVSKSPFMQALQAFAKNPEAKRLAQWTNGEWANNPEVDGQNSAGTCKPLPFAIYAAPVKAATSGPSHWCIIQDFCKFALTQCLQGVTVCRRYDRNRPANPLPRIRPRQHLRADA